MKAIISVDDDLLITQLVTFQLSKYFNSKEVLIESVNDPELIPELIADLSKIGFTTELIIADYQMPKLNGAELVQNIKAQYPEIHFIMLSGQADEIVVEELLKSGLIETFIPKPWEEHYLIECVSKLLTSQNG